MKSVLEVKKLSVSFAAGAEVKHAINNLSFSLEPGGALGIIGESGAGKTTLALALMGLLDHGEARVSGEVVFQGKNLLALPEAELCRVRGAGIGLIFQDAPGSLDPGQQVLRQVAEAVIRHGDAPDRKAALRKAGKLLAETGLKPSMLAAAPYPHQLSGGMCQRAMIAATVACSPRVLIADEPASSLDPPSQAQIIGLLKEMQRLRDLAMIFISHDLALVSTIVDYLIVMRAGAAVEQGKTGEVLSRPAHPYTVQLVNAWKGFGQKRDEQRCLSLN